MSCYFDHVIIQGTFSQLAPLQKLIGTLRCQDGDDNENVEKAIG